MRGRGRRHRIQVRTGWKSFIQLWPPLLLGLVALISAASVAAEAFAALPAPLPPVSAEAYVLMDENSGQILAAKNPDERRAPASLTKIVTAAVALNTQPVTVAVQVSPAAAAMQGSRFGLRAGDREQLWKLLYGMLLRSGNDAAVAVAESSAGSVPRFVSCMNHWAEAMGARSTHFSNPDGLPAASHYSTARDLAVLARAALRNPEFARIVRTRQRTVSWNGIPRVISNINRFVGDYAGATGIKTGYADSAGFCLAASAQRGTRRLILILLGCPSSSRRWEDASVLMNYGFRNYEALAWLARHSEALPVGGIGTALPSKGMPRLPASGDRPGSNTGSYAVRPGDTLWDIARRFGISVSLLSRVNRIPPSGRIQPGQRLILPAKTSSVTALPAWEPALSPTVQRSLVLRS